MLLLKELEIIISKKRILSVIYVISFLWLFSIKTKILKIELKIQFIL